MSIPLIHSSDGSTSSVLSYKELPKPAPIPSPTSCHTISIVGGGLAGGMLALLLGQKGEKIRLIEQREDFRRIEKQGTEGFDSTFGRATSSIKRSINLALSYRGICALKECGLFDKIQDKLIPMKGRVVHLPPDGKKLSFQPYGVGDQAIYSISRSNLNQLLLDELDKLPNVETIFGDKVVSIDKQANILLRNKAGVEYTLPSKFVVGADGAYSSVRRSLQHHVRLDLSMTYITHGYKELTIPATSSGDFAMDMWQGLHIWPRHEFMLIALPNPDKTFTCTLFAPFEGKHGLDSLNTDDEIISYFHTYFPDMIPLCPDLISEFRSSPSSSLVTVRASPWNYKDKIVILGDAAHACVPFYGQGMNCAFEDCLLFTEIFTSNHGDALATLTQFNTERCPAGHAIADLSLENYIEMRSSTASRWYLMKKYIDGALHRIAPSLWIPKYTMVAFTRTPYHIASLRAQRQDRILKRVIISLGSITVVGIVGLSGYWYWSRTHNTTTNTTTSITWKK